jgi:hypothetical protein
MPSPDRKAPLNGSAIPRPSVKKTEGMYTERPATQLAPELAPDVEAQGVINGEGDALLTTKTAENGAIGDEQG